MQSKLAPIAFDCTWAWKQLHSMLPWLTGILHHGKLWAQLCVSTLYNNEFRWHGCRQGCPCGSHPTQLECIKTQTQTSTSMQNLINVMPNWPARWQTRGRKVGRKIQTLNWLEHPFLCWAIECCPGSPMRFWNANARVQMQNAMQNWVWMQETCNEMQNLHAL